METKHTPGPWKVSEYHGGIYTDDGDAHSAVVEIAVIPFMREWRQGSPQEGKHATYDKQRANARLIAAAPELLAALVDVWEDWRTLSGVDHGAAEEYDDVRRIDDMARAAIAKARGQ